MYYSLVIPRGEVQLGRLPVGRVSVYSIMDHIFIP